MGQGDTEEDEEVAHVAKVNNKKRRTFGQSDKGKQHDLGENSKFSQQRDRETCLQIIVC